MLLIMMYKGKLKQALIIPGGFGAAKNFSDFAINGEKFNVKPQIEKVIKQFYNVYNQ